MLKQISKVINDSKKTVKASHINNIAKDYSYLECFLNTGKKKFIEKDEESSDEFEVEIYQSLYLIQRLECSEAILNFEKNRSVESFNIFLNSIYMEIIRFNLVADNIRDVKTVFLESDLVLLYFFIIIYCSDHLVDFEIKLESGLNQLINYHTIKNLDLKKYAGRNSLCYLAYIVSKKINNNSYISELFLKSCEKNIDPIYNKISKIDQLNNEEKKEIIGELVDYHLKNSKLDHFSSPFFRKYWIYYPLEIFIVIKIFNMSDFIKNDDELLSRFNSFFLNDFIPSERNIDLMEMSLKK
ncbi:hypothetical protein [Acinetobacter bereziniae]|uniref:hypothetical protein n=1 Tax=Acinetobacter bereziniae TaxID=106648 RepID=UPI0035714D8E